MPTLEQVRAAMGSRSAQSFVVEAEGRRAGIVRLAWYGDPVWLAELRLIAVETPRNGIGGAALRWAQHHAFVTLGAHRMYLEVAAHNAHARRLYEHRGFVLEGTWRDGFRADDGTFHDLLGYGMLDREYKPD